MIIRIKMAWRVIQWLKNFIWGVNDTMNLPSYVLGRVWTYLSPQWSALQKSFDSLTRAARAATDMWQSYYTGWYGLWRIAPAIAWAALAPISSAPVALSEAETVWLMLPALWWQTSYRSSLPSWDRNRREAMRQQDADRKQQIANSFALWKSQWVNFNDPQIKPLIRKLVLEYYSL